MDAGTIQPRLDFAALPATSTGALGPGVQQKARPELYDLTDYSKSRTFGVSLRWPTSGNGENGIVYDSVRRNGGTNVCVFRPSLISLPVVQGDHYQYNWDSRGNVSVSKLANIEH